MAKGIMAGTHSKSRRERVPDFRSCNTETATCIEMFGYSHSMSSVCLPETRVYCDKTVKNRIMWLSLKFSLVPQLYDKLDDEIRRGPIDRLWVVFDFSTPISRDRPLVTINHS